jgi:hypothetical protein
MIVVVKLATTHFFCCGGSVLFGGERNEDWAGEMSFCLLFFLEWNRTKNNERVRLADSVGHVQQKAIQRLFFFLPAKKGFEDGWRVW